MHLASGLFRLADRRSCPHTGRRRDVNRWSSANAEALRTSSALMFILGWAGTTGNARGTAETQPLCRGRPVVAVAHAAHLRGRKSPRHPPHDPHSSAMSVACATRRMRLGYLAWTGEFQPSRSLSMRDAVGEGIRRRGECRTRLASRAEAGAEARGGASINATRWECARGSRGRGPRGPAAAALAEEQRHAPEACEAGASRPRCHTRAGTDMVVPKHGVRALLRTLGGLRSARPASHVLMPPPPRHSPTRTQGSADHERSPNDTHAEAAGDLRLLETQREAQKGACQKRAIGLHAASVRLHEAVQEHSESDSVLADMPAPGNVATDDQMEGRGRRRTPQKWRPGNWEAETRQAHQERHQMPPS